METPETRLIFSGTVQGLFHMALRGRLSEGARTALREAGLDLEKDLLPAYPITTWVRCLDIARRDLWPELPPDESWRELGRTVVQGINSTMLGRAMVAASKALGPRASLGQLHRAFRGSDNYVELRVTERTPRSHELWINDILDRPVYYAGILEAVLLAMSVRAPRVSVLRREGPACTFLLEWDA
jgi:uncharacterized protein (TIGR02265 family)